MAKPTKPRSTGARAGSADYPVGYRKPPKTSQFKKGQSGNPSGASKKARARKADGDSSIMDQWMLKEARRKIPITENGVRSEITTYEAAARKLAISAAKGERSAQKEYFDRVHSAQEREVKERMARFGLIAQYKQEQVVARAGGAIITAMPVWPNPDDVVLEFVICSGEVLGPINVQQAQPFITLVGEYRIWQARHGQLRALANQVEGDLLALNGTTVRNVEGLLDAIRRHVPPSFKVELEWEEGEIPSGALEIADPAGGTINLAILSPEGDDTFYALHIVNAWAAHFEREIPRRTKLDIAANTTSLINRLQVERQNRDGGAPPPPAVIEFAQLYEEFVLEGHDRVDEAAP